MSMLQEAPACHGNIPEHHLWEIYATNSLTYAINFINGF